MSLKTKVVSVDFLKDILCGLSEVQEKLRDEHSSEIISGLSKNVREVLNGELSNGIQEENQEEIHGSKEIGREELPQGGPQGPLC